MRALRRLALLVVLLLAGLTSLVAGSMAFSPDCDDLPATGQAYDVAVVLSAGLLPGELDASTLDRTRAAISLFERGIVGRLLMTGDASPGAWSTARSMRKHAVENGIPADRITIEPDSGSTLQNALFSLPLLPPGARILLVTEGFHLWRGWASFAWAGHPPDGLCQSSPIAAPAEAIHLIPREVAAWAANLVRASIWSAADLAGAERALPADFLR